MKRLESQNVLSPTPVFGDAGTPVNASERKFAPGPMTGLADNTSMVRRARRAARFARRANR